MPHDGDGGRRSRERLLERLRDLRENLLGGTDAVRRATGSFARMDEAAQQMATEQSTAGQAWTEAATTIRGGNAGQAWTEAATTIRGGNAADLQDAWAFALRVLQDRQHLTVESQEVVMPVEQPVRTESGEVEVQRPLLPEEPVQPEFFSALLDQIDVGISPTPAADLIQSIRLLGVFQPVALVRRGRRFTVAEGRRRVLAAREAGLVYIPAVVYPEHTPLNVAAAMTLTGNTARRPNPLAELEAIERFVSEGANAQQISRELGISMATVEARMRLGSLPSELRQALADGRLAPGVAEQAARLDAERQQQLVRLLRAREEHFPTEGAWQRAVTGRDVREARQVRRDQQVEALPSSVFETPTPRAVAQILVESMPTPVDMSAVVGRRISEDVIRFEDQAYIREAEVVRRTAEALEQGQHLGARQLHGMSLSDGRRWNFYHGTPSNPVEYFLLTDRPYVGSVSIDTPGVRRFVDEARLPDVGERIRILTEQVAMAERQRADAERQNGDLTQQLVAARAMLSSQIAAVPLPETAIDRLPLSELPESWDSVVRVTETLAAVLPAEASGASDTFDGLIDQMRTLADRERTREHGAQRTAQQGPLHAAAEGLRTATARHAVERVSGYLRYGRTTEGRWFERYRDANGRMRRRWSAPPANESAYLSAPMVVNPER
jgi:ParB/RepB/Spo0J family partition protein